jgi:formate dehydrogenase beta subunit
LIMAKAMLYDASKCMACRGCQVACKSWWGLPTVVTENMGTYENPPSLSAETWNKIRFTEIGHNGNVRWLFTRQSCMHCTNAVCVWVCPTYARKYNELGYVTIDQGRCIGCSRCVMYCPFQVPMLGGLDVSNRIVVESGVPRNVTYNCIFCLDRLEDGLTPACVKTCPSKALTFGEREDMVRQGRVRVDTLKSTYPQANLYGASELDGLHLMLVLTEKPSVLGLPATPTLGTYPEFQVSDFPDWYVQAIADEQIPTFPPDARPDWYLQPDLIPEEKLGPFYQKVPLAMQTLWGYIGVGILGAAWWFIRRRAKLQGETEKGIKK